MPLPFTINARPGRTTVSLFTHHYDRSAKRTKTVYAGSFRRDLDPSAVPLQPTNEPIIPAGIRVRGGFEHLMDGKGLVRIRQWLDEHGTYKVYLQRATHAERLAAEEAARSRDAMRREVEADVMRGLGGCWRSEGSVPAGEEAAYALTQLEQAIEVAAREVTQAAARARAEGLFLTSLRSQAVHATVGQCLLDRLQTRTNRVRLNGFQRFIAACQEAGLMERRSPVRRR